MFKASRHGIERLEICDKEDNKNPKIITLENCVKITQEPSQANQITIVTKTGTLTLNALNETELKHWVQALQSVAFKDKSATLMRNSVIEEDNDLYCTSYSDGIFTVKLLASDIAHMHCNLEAKSYILHLTTTEIQLKHIDNNSAIVAKWPYRYVRKYGYRDGKFTFEAGRKCDTGEGVFSLQHSNPQEVFRCMAAKMKSMKKLISGESLDCGEHQLNAALSMEPGSRSPLPPSQHQNHSDNDLNQSGHLIREFLSSDDSLNNVQMSLSMSALTPIVKHIPNKPPRKTIASIDVPDKINKTIDEMPSPKLQSRKFTKYQDYEPFSLAFTEGMKSSPLAILKTQPQPPLPTSPPIPPSNNSGKSLLKKNDILAAAGSSSSSPIIVDHPPQLPVRNESMNLDDRNYERIENISNAWKTLGVSDVKHIEHMNDATDDNNLVEFEWQRSQSQKDKKPSKSPMNTYCDADEHASSKCAADAASNYDKLEFFATKNNRSNDYRTIVTISSPAYKKQTSQPVTSNDYEIIGDCITSEQKPYRMADDSYMGYGILRRKPGATTPDLSHNTPVNTDELLSHWNFNGKEYALVSKPKHV